MLRKSVHMSPVKMSRADVEHKRCIAGASGGEQVLHSKCTPGA